MDTAVCVPQDSVPAGREQRVGMWSPPSLRHVIEFQSNFNLRYVSFNFTIVSRD